MAKRKLRGSPARGGGSSPASPMAARLSRGFPPSLGMSISVSREPQQGATASKRVSVATSPSPRNSGTSIGGCITWQSEQIVSPSSFASAGKRQQLGGGERDAKEEELPALASLASLGSSPIEAVVQAPGASQQNTSSGGALKRHQLLQHQQQQQQPNKKQANINDMMAKAKKASDNIRLLLHAKVRKTKGPP